MYLAYALNLVIFYSQIAFTCIVCQNFPPLKFSHVWVLHNKYQKMPNITILTKLFTKLGHTVLSICNSRLFTTDHWIPIGCNTLLQAYSHEVTIKKATKYFGLCASVLLKCLMCKKLAWNEPLIFVIECYDQKPTKI